MQLKYSGKQHSLVYRIFDFIGHSNIFIALCAASLTAWSQELFLHKFSYPFICITFSATFLLYNAQRMYLSFIERKRNSSKHWQYKKKYFIIVLMVLSLAGLYPVLWISKGNMLVYFVSFCLGIFYFLPFSNLRAIPGVKSFIVGLVWVLVCIAAPLEEYVWGIEKTFFCIIQLFLISALCVLFNIRDTEEDRKSGTHSIPVLFGIKKTKIVNYAILLFYLSLAPYVQLSFHFFVVCFITFALSCVYTLRSSLQNHPFFYTFGVDGIILAQSLLGIFLT